MHLYLIRHADALALGERGVTDDADRPLSQQGENQMEVLARGFPAKGIHLDLVLCSPFVRARQTAEILTRRGSAASLEIQFSDTLLPEASPRKLARLLQDLQAARIGLIGHAPHLPSFAAWLIGGKNAQIDLAKAGVVYLTCDRPPGKGAAVLHWMVSPEWFA